MNMENGRRKLLIRVVATLVVIGVALLFIPIPRPVHKTVEAFEIRHNDPDHGVLRSVTIDGTYRQYIWGNREDEFHGRIAIDGYEETLTPGKSLINTFMDGVNPFPLCYVTPDFYLRQFGSIIATKKVDRFAILVNENDGWGGGDGLTVLGPAASKEEARQIYDRFTAASEWFAASEWPE